VDGDGLLNTPERKLRFMADKYLCDPPTVDTIGLAQGRVANALPAKHSRAWQNSRRLVIPAMRPL